MIPIYQTDPSNTQYKYIGFHARALSKSERKYSTTKRELLAIVFALKKYHQFLWGNHSTLYTDHKSLTYLHTKPVTNPMMGGWLDTICDYNLTIVHRPGILNVLPDTLSRLFTPDKRLAEGNSPKASHSGDSHHLNQNDKTYLRKLIWTVISVLTLLSTHSTVTEYTGQTSIRKL